ncbi:N-acetylglucosamine-6-phosphate deacetylase [Sphingobacterium faecium]|uniref:N-acetylglucosamine-6-phosphate deacetylase n=1 Tax=Sphingobacterium faecium TaxID=34087 RepID=UPI00097ED2E3|nr:N-acetylglucosamine-6-phosphate deacetylase [Sphingobacterium faecium]WGQ13091.1 N-acetylglucosamine-6-phosphate deacetylase [Sphingobacterium faecium]SJN51197.1 N-acetylglucosamine-6-phosphate deacetylase [Sphingobacterium faecium PCAi_F2.5]HCU45875.1 N-acetylglucosamine-6-phosphate deacetylase [Sphingobacterium sp.]
MNKLAIVGGNIFSDYDLIEHKALLVENGIITAIVDPKEIPTDWEQLDVKGANICAGLIDLQLYGDGDDLFSAELTAASLQRISDGLVRKGTTSYMMTLATNTFHVFQQAIQVAGHFKHDALLGLHLEGPFLNSKKRGAHPAELIVKPTKENIKELLGDHPSIVKMMTIAPECIDDDVLEYLQSYGLLLSAGHSDATYKEGTKGFDLGIPTGTHLFNAMSALHQREVGMVGAIFNHPTVCSSIILDGHHVSFEAVKIAKKQMGERLFLITDAVAACSKGIYQHVLNDGYYSLPDGTISGAAVSLFESVRNAVQQVGIPLDEAIRMATTYPARLLKRTDIGNLNLGSIANLLIFSADYKLQEVLVKGKLISK